MSDLSDGVGDDCALCIVNCALMQPEADEVEGEETEAEAAKGALEAGFGAAGLKN